MIHPTYAKAITKLVNYLADEDEHLLEHLYTDYPQDNDEDEEYFDKYSEEELYKFCIDNNVEHIWVQVYEVKMFINQLTTYSE